MNWSWNFFLAPDIESVFPRAAWLSFTDSNYTTGGLVERLINLADDPLLVLVESGDRVLASVSTPEIVSSVVSTISANASIFAEFVPGVKSQGKYPVSSPGLTVASTALDLEGNPVPPEDFRMAIISPPPPLYSASSIVNRLSVLCRERGDIWMVILDQLSGSVWAMVRSSSVPHSVAALNVAESQIIVALQPL